MPKAIENRLRSEATKKGLFGKQADRYVYGAMNNRGYMRGNKETAKGASVEAQYDSDHPGFTQLQQDLASIRTATLPKKRRGQ